MPDPRENAIGDIQGQIQQIIDNSSINTGRYDPIHNIWTYFTPQMNYNQLNSLLMGNQNRALGNAGRLATATANATGLNPYAAQQHAMSGIYGQYADQFANLPFRLQQANLAANQGNFQNLYQLLALKSGLAGQRSGSPLGGILAGLGTIGGALIGGPSMGSSLGQDLSAAKF